MLQQENRFPWNYHEHQNTEFWCAALGQYVFLTPDVESNGIYYVRVANSMSQRRYPVRGNQLVLAESKEAKEISLQGNGFPINVSNWTQIKNWICDDFIDSGYQWYAAKDKSPLQVKDSWLSFAKSPRNGLARFIENERQAGFFLDKVTFETRMKQHNAEFPWLDLAEKIDFSLPQT